MPVKAVIFDIGGVVVESDFPALYSRFAERIGIAPGAVVDYHKENKDDLLLGNITLEDFVRDMRALGADQYTNIKAAFLEEGLSTRRLNRKLIKVIETLRARYTVGTLTNLMYSRMIIDEATGVYEHFDFKVLSCIEHAMKPAPEIFHIALTRAEAKPEEAIFVDDRQEYVAAAQDIGLHAIIYHPDNHEQFLARLQKLATL